MNSDMTSKAPMTCEGCGKADCEQCVTDGKKSFCCQHCCDDYNAANAGKEQPESVNVCRFC